uniref:NADH dehydrogenase subunit 3 n=1 Tax=Symphyocladiella dendroidea TaxID=2506487 RepID=UPI0022FD3885|nr:NADH dehydrogenase subunit 3 [Symphyocladiella dendroidea]WAX04030.1 NADH dehydrogenase subunit 3 [Symphyocladiella dendroidea]
MNIIFYEYFFIFIFFIFSFIFSFLIYFLSYLFIFQKADQEKLSAYECGFNPFEDARMTFDIRFYLVAILFLIFDLEISFLFPWIISLKTINFFGFAVMLFFLLILTLGFIYEWFKGALEWE